MRNFKAGYFLILILGLPLFAFAQIKQYGPARKAAPKKEISPNARQHALNPVSLPFWDDFSYAEGHRADPLLWIVNDKVFVNNGQAINPPSINVATFDGYNENGIPYSSVPLETGYGDTLESQPILMGTVPAQYRDKIYLSFFYQAGGNSEMPNPSDFLKLEFRSASGWVEIHRFTIKSNADPSTFYDTAIQIPNTGPVNYFHNDFQFRFTSFGRLSGSYDAWHLDYVYLNRRVSNDQNTSISDRAIADPFTSILGDGYYAVPYRHFIGDPDAYLVHPTVEYYNLKDTSFAQVIDYTTYFTITTFNDNIPDINFQGGENKDDVLPLESRERSVRGINNLLTASNFITDADSAHIELKVGFNSGDLNEDYYSRYVPIEFRHNDTIQHTFILSNYYAYDDGVAEYSAGLAAQGNQLAYRFVMNASIGEDTLNGVYFYFPYTGNTVPENIQIFVFDDKAGKPDSAFLYTQTVPLVRSANNVFMLIEFTEGVLVSDTFYIGYQETITGDPDRIRIGLDASHDTGSEMFYRNTVFHPWVQNTDLEGNLMIRPRFGKAVVITGTEEEVQKLAIYPNPNRGEFYLDGYATNLQIISLTGQPVNFRTNRKGNVTSVTLANARPGMYIVRYRSGSKVFTDKVLVTEN